MSASSTCAATSCGPRSLTGLRILPTGEVALELKTPWKDGTAWLTMSSDTLLERLASLVPRPGTHQVLFRASER